MSRFPLIVATALIGASPLIAESAIAAAAGNDTTLNIGIVNDITGREIDPALTAGGTAIPFLYSVYETLYAFDKHGVPQPRIVESDEISDDKLTVTLHIRKGQTFQDGSALTADDVVFSLNRNRGADGSLKGPTNTASLASIKSVEKIDDYTVAVHLSSPDPILKNSLAYLGGMVVPSDYVQKVGEDEFLRHPVGSGPYKFADAKQGQFVDLSVFDHYAFDHPGYYRKVHLQVLPEGATRIAQLRARDIDFAIDVDISQIASLKAQGFNVVTNPSGQVLSILFNSRSGRFGNPRVGQAFNMAVDKNAIVNSIYLDRASVMSSNDPTITPDDVPPIAYDPEGAKRLLRDAKFDFNRTLKLDYPAGRYPRDQLLVQAVQAYLGAIGVKVELRPVDGATWLKGLREKSLDDMTLTLNSNVNYDSYQSLWSGSSSEGPWSLWTNPEFDSALNSIASTTGEARRVAFINLAKETQKNPQAIYLLDFHQVYAMRHGITWTPTPGIRNFDFTTIRPE